MIRYLVVDVDGTMTDGGLYYGPNNAEFKKFNTRDAQGFFLAEKAGIQVLVVTGRASEMVERRMSELHVTLLFQNIFDKASFLADYMAANGIAAEEIAYIGDDLNDIEAMKLVSFVCCPADSCKEVLAIADYISVKNGGCGVVRDCVEFLVKKTDKSANSLSYLEA